MRPSQLAKLQNANDAKSTRKFVNLINDRKLRFLDDTVSELLLENSPEIANLIDLNFDAGDSANQLVKIAKSLSYRVQEDPSRVAYPSCCEFPSFRPVNWTELEEEDEISDGVHRVFCKTDGVPYVLKVVNRPLYYPHDTEVIRKELENLELFKGVPGIVQPTGIAVTSNLYDTVKNSEKPLVISGILLEFYSGGPLERILKDDLVKEYNWQRWPIQIGTALSHIHEAGRTHMDIEPANVVLDAKGNAVLLDISGIGGITYS